MDSPPDDQDILLVGTVGDLSRRKLLPALYNLSLTDGLPRRVSIIGLGRRQLSDDDFRAIAREAVEGFSRTKVQPAAWDAFARRLRFSPLSAEGFEQLAKQAQPRRLVYLATPPEGVPQVIRDLGAHGLAEGTRLVVEKPFGMDLTTAQQLNATLHEVFSESQIFRIDHYLAKETVQNILVFRFANSVFERVWNRDAVDHVHITVAESIGIEHRGSFYDEVGALRDIVQSHALQMLALLMMEPPAAFDAEAIRDEKTKLLRALKPLDPRDVVQAQYTAGVIEGEAVPGYREEEGVKPDSKTETFVALRLWIENWRWAGVPVFLRTGKRLPYRAAEMEIAFKRVPTGCFDGADHSLPHPNHLTLSIQPRELIQFQFLAKVPGRRMDVKQVAMEFTYDESFDAPAPEAYERLLRDAMAGDQTLFVREDTVERSWEIVEPVLRDRPPTCFYPAGTWGPPEADALIAPNRWHLHQIDAAGIVSAEASPLRL